MKRPFRILLLGVVLAAVGFCAFYFGATARQRAVMHSANPELGWLREEFNLSDADYKSVCALHDAYRPQCQKMCGLIAEKNDELRMLIAQTNVITPEIARMLEEASQLRAECHKGMLAHFFAVSQKMPTEQGKRYLAWVQEKTLLGHDGMMANEHQSEAHE
jgi:hypothetical protein